MVRRTASAALRAGRSQLLGLVAQLLGAAPLIGMSIYLSHVVGLKAVAEYAVLVGASAVAFTVGMVGLRSRLVLDRFQSFDEDDYYVLRSVASLLMALSIVTWGQLLGAPLILTVAVALMRVGDAALDLIMALDQVRREDREHMYGYIRGAGARIVLLVLVLGLADLTDLVSPYSAFALASGLHAGYVWMLFLKRRESRVALCAPGRGGSVLRLLRHSMVFAVAQIICALLTSAPRIALPTIADRDLAGASAAALSVATLIGMSYFAIWLRWLPRLGMAKPQMNRAAAFLGEMSVALALVLVCVWFMGRPAMALVYGIESPGHLDMTHRTLMACAVFFFIMTLANLFKPSRLPWAESAIYCGGLVAIWLAFTARPGISIPGLLLAGALGMAILGMVSLTVLLVMRRRQPKEAA